MTLAAKEAEMSSAGYPQCETSEYHRLIWLAKGIL